MVFYRNYDKTSGIFFSCPASKPGLPRCNRLKWPIIWPFLDEISKFLVPMKTVLNYEFF